MIIIGCGLLFWNEGRAVKTSVSLDGKYLFHSFEEPVTSKTFCNISVKTNTP